MVIFSNSKYIFQCKLSIPAYSVHYSYFLVFFLINDNKLKKKIELGIPIVFISTNHLKKMVSVISIPFNLIIEYEKTKCNIGTYSYL